MRTFVIGDIHGGFKALHQVLERAQVTSSDKLIFLGDYVDGWSESAELIQFLIELNKQQECIFIRGNHDLWCDLWLNKGASNPIWQMHGGKETVASYVKTGYLIQDSHKQFFSAMKNYYLDQNNKLYLHAGFVSEKGVGFEDDETTYFFNRSLWQGSYFREKGQEDDLVKNLKIVELQAQYHEIYIGHTPTINYGKDIPMKAGNVWNIDTGAAFKGKLSILDTETKQYWQSDPVWELYPDEKGRN